MHTVLRCFKNKYFYVCFMYQILMLRRILITSLEYSRVCNIGARIIYESAVAALP